MQIHSHEPTVRTLHYQLQVEHAGDGTPAYKGGLNEEVHDKSIFDEFHQVPIPGKAYSALDEICGRKNTCKIYICADKLAAERAMEKKCVVYYV
eukprot:129284-Karenia_brevis.AAC.1